MRNHVVNPDNEHEDAYEREPDARETSKMNGPGSKTGVEEEGPACQSCRQKKAKCSRRSPCSHCEKFRERNKRTFDRTERTLTPHEEIDCIYENRKSKPGLRTGAVENLTQRVIALENMFLGQGILWQQVWGRLNHMQDSSDSTSVPAQTPSNPGGTLKDCTSRLRSELSSVSRDFELPETESSIPVKRRRTTSIAEEDRPPPRSRMREQQDHENDLPPDDLVDALVEIYFSNIHPWIPILHVKQFRERMAIPTDRQKLRTIFHAIVSLCVRFSQDERLKSAEVRARYSKRSREIVILQSMESFSVENLQALIICAFDTIGSGRGPSAWSIVGSMTRTVEQLQLSVESEDQPQSAEFLIKRMAFLAPSTSWTEREQRRRVFWSVFLMDRFCSIATGWNYSLTSADVKRRLPCEGALWEEGKPLKTPAPYFGVADKSACGALPTARPELEDQESIGGFAYCIEACESLSLVTTFFLRHAVNVSKVQDVQIWLMRFKELDLRLVQWKVFLPAQWQEACALNADGVLDPNLTLAHITHNTAVGLLHQGIAYPSPEWKASPIRLPSVSSAETCMTAATEVAIIAEKYLQASTSLTNPQFGFCLFICGRMLLAHSLHYSIMLPPEFDSLINSLREISSRWNGPHAHEPDSKIDNLASKFASRLAQARDQGPHTLDIRQSAYSEDQNHESTTISQQNVSNQSSHFNQQGILSNNQISGPISSEHDLSNGNHFMSEQEGSPDSISLAFPPLPLAFQPHCASATQTTMHSPASHNEQLNSFYDQKQLGEATFPHAAFSDQNMGYDMSGAGVDDLNSFFEYSFLPTQRISMFSLQNEKDASSHL